ncbi:MAG: OmpA family protein, partial [Polyangiales bacterium]
MTQLLVRLALLGVVLCAPALALGQAQGQAYAIDRFDVSERGSDWFVGDSLDLRGRIRPSLGVVLDYAHKPLVLYALNGDERAVVVEDRLFAHFGASLVLADRVRLALNLPVALITKGERGRVLAETLEAEEGASLGDLRVGADVRLLGEYGDPATLAAGAQLYLPSGNTEAFAGDGRVRVVPHLLLAGQVGSFDYSARVALDVRTANDTLAGVPHGTSVSFAATAGVSLLNRLVLIGPEVWGSTVVVDDGAFDKATTPLELLLGVHVRPKHFRTGVAFGPGLSRGQGTPTWRAVAMLEWSPSVTRERVVEHVPTAPDRDLDGVVDVHDACPDVPGVATADPATNGCPPPSDRDRDAVIDREDDCPDVPGVASPVAGKNGCPPDHDGDGILDHQDACPTVPGPADPDPLKNGCPIARIDHDEIVITERIEFEFDSAKLLESSFGVLVAVMNVLREHTELNVVLIEGHTDYTGGPEYNKQLSERRAESVRKWLVEHGVEASRLIDAGFG